MSRHRNVRSMNYADECYDDEDDYSYSYDDNYCISPGTVAQFTFNREKDVNLATYMGDEETEDQASSLHDSTNNLQSLNKLSDIDRAKLNSCMEELKNILGETTSDNIMIECILRHGFNTEASLNELLNQTEAPKPQRQPRERRNRSEGDENDFFAFSETNCPTSVSVPKNQVIRPLNNNTIKDKTGTPPLKSIDSLSQYLSKMSTQNNKLVHKKSDSTTVAGKLNLKNDKNVNQTSSSSLADLANQYQNSGLSLSQLADQHQASKSLSELANQNTSNHSGLSLADLAAKHQQNPDSNTTNRNTSAGVSLAVLANQHQLNKKEDASNQSQTCGLSLADLASKHNSTQTGSSSLTSNIPSTNQITTPGFSLADLANQHQSNLASSNEDGSKNVSLSGLANQHQKTTEVTNEKKGNSTGSKLSLAEMAAIHESNIHSSCNGIPNIEPSQSDWSLGDPDVNLCNLNKSNSSVNTPNMVTGFSLAELAKQNVRCGESSNRLETKSDFGGNSLPEITLTSLAIKKPSKSKKETTSGKKVKVVDRQPSEMFFEETDYNDSELFIEKSPSFSLDKTLIKSSSSLGKVLVMKYEVRERVELSPYWKVFQYSNQIKSTVARKDIKLHIIKEFNFDTPSPDDIVKQRQKAAFT